MTDVYDFGLAPDPATEKHATLSRLNKKTEPYRALLSELIDTAFRVKTRRAVDEADLAVWERGLSAPHVDVFSHYTGRFVSALSHELPSVQEWLIGFVAHPSAKVRLNLVTIMLHHPNDRVLDTVLAAGLADKSATVRAKAADVIERVERTHFAERLPALIAAETSDKAKETMEHCLYWLTHDYQVYDRTERGYSIWVKVATGMTGRTISEAEYQDLEKTVARIRAEHDELYG
ncbi:hypothetical protein [Flaviaesturariibacter amylovorans]|uniref:HEAT repeat domain-containing protein n=1 Tax=Flaviaesturariibacter amylovorans TaxID=1084520 RepID=A0ABP8G542_9BACT